MNYAQPTKEVALQLLQPYPLGFSPNTAGPNQSPPNQEFGPATIQFLQDIRGFLNDPLTAETFRAHPTDFTRESPFSFPALVITILRGHAMPIQMRLNLLFNEGAFRNRSDCPTASAFC